MKRVIIILTLAVIFSYPLPGFSAFTTYTNRATFEVAMGSYVIDGWETYGTVGTGTSGALSGLNFYDFQVTTTPDALKILDAPYVGGFNTTPAPGSSHYLYLDTDIGLQGSTATFGMHSPTLGFGFDYGGVNEVGTAWDVTIMGTTFTLAVNGSNDAADAKFWGVISDTAFSSIALYTFTDSGYSVDEVTYSGAAQPVPEPVSMLLLGFGLLGVTGLRKVFKG